MGVVYTWNKRDCVISSSCDVFIYVKIPMDDKKRIVVHLLLKYHHKHYFPQKNE